MRSKIYLFVAALISITFYAQEIYGRYPEKQDFYEGGRVQFYKDFQRILIEKNMKPCENRYENYSMGIVVYPDHSIKYVKSDDEKEMQEFKCTFDLTREVLKYLDGWVPAEVDGKKVAAITNVLIIPHDLFGDLKPNYDPLEGEAVAVYEGGINKFRKKVFQNIDLNRFTFKGTFRLKVTFIVERDGTMSNVKLEESSGLKQFDDMVLRAVSTIKRKWQPARISNIPVRSYYRLPLAFTME